MLLGRSSASRGRMLPGVVFKQLLPLQREWLVLKGQDPLFQLDFWQQGGLQWSQGVHSDAFWWPWPFPRCNEWESQGRSWEWRRVWRKEAFLGDLALSLFSSLGGPFPPLFPPLPLAKFFKLISDLSTPPGYPCWKLRANVGGNMQLLPKLTQVPWGGKNSGDRPGPQPRGGGCCLNHPPFFFFHWDNEENKHPD